MIKKIENHVLLETNRHERKGEFAWRKYGRGSDLVVGSVAFLKPSFMN